MLSTVLTLFASEYTDNLIKGLKIFGYGMFFIFLVLGAIVLVTFLMNIIARKILQAKKRRDDLKASLHEPPPSNGQER